MKIGYRQLGMASKAKKVAVFNYVRAAVLAYMRKKQV